MRKAIFLLIFLLLLPIVQAQVVPPDYLLRFLYPTTAQLPSTAPDWVRTIVASWLVLLVGGCFFIAFAYVVKAMSSTGAIALMSVGVILLFLSIIAVMIGFLLPLLGKPTVTYEECKKEFKLDVSVLTAPGLTYVTSCILTGYAPTNIELAGWLNFTTFIIFGIILPLALLITLFCEFVPEGMITSRAARRVIGVIGALFAFRGIFGTLFVEILSYGFTGIGALSVAVLFTGYAWKIAYRFITPLGVKISTEMRYFILSEAEQIKREIEELQKTKTALTEEGKPTQDIDDRINRLTKRLNELEKKGK
jgi:hypothetical protein